MIKDITLGQYYQTDSVIHRMDPRFKLTATLMYIISLFISRSPYVYIVALLFLIIAISVSKVPLKFILKGMGAIWFLMIMTVIFNMFWGSGEILVTVWRFSITKDGLINAVMMCSRLILLIIGSSIMTLTTTPNSLTDGLERLLGPLKVFKIPVHEMAMMMSIALRFIPILMEETDIIMKAQLSRGADFESKNVLKKAKSLIPVLVPLFVSAFRRASDLAMAMEARCYHGGEGRTKMKPLKYHFRDLIGYIFLTIYFAGIILMKIYL